MANCFAQNADLISHIESYPISHSVGIAHSIAYIKSNKQPYRQSNHGAYFARVLHGWVWRTLFRC